MIHRFLLFSLVLCGCSNPTEDLRKQLEKSEEVAKGPGHIEVKDFELLGSMNESIQGELKFGFTKVDSYDNVVAYRDKNSSLVLTTMGKDGKYTLVEIIMPLKDFLSKEKSDEGAVRFCHCARRMAKAIDAELEKPVEKLVNENIAKAVSTKDGVYMRHNHMIVKFNCNKLGNVKFVNFVVGIPD